MDPNDRIEKLARARRILDEYKAQLDELNADIEADYGKRLKRVKSLLATAEADVQDYAREIGVFVNIGTEPRATIARDLSEYLEVKE